MGIRLVEICALAWWVQIWDFWFHPPCFCATQKRWTDGLYMHGSQREAWRRRCDGVGVLCWWHCWGFIQNWRHTEPAWLPQHPAATCHPIQFAFSWTIIYFSTGQWHQTHLQAVLTEKESDGVLRQMTWPPQSPDLNPIETVWDEMDLRVKAKGPTSAQHLWELLQDCWKTISGDYLMKLIERMPRVCKAVIKAKGGHFEESKI